ncbi:MAG TPA: SMC-Scp complex subunit ScpB [Micromonosporaceae bacterium]|nr:SMC-Scp complex subunit ScpB [Micromonosporaceae bacterium]
MNPEQESPSLADKAASWVPPWRRPTDPGEARSPEETGQPPAGDDATAQFDPDEFPEAGEEPGPVDTVAAPPEPFEPTGWTEMVGVPTRRPEFAPRDDMLVQDDFAPIVDLGRRLHPVAPLGTPEDLRAALEAIMLVVDQPVTEGQLAEVLDVPVADVTAHLTGLSAEYSAQNRGFELRRAAGGWRLYTRPEYAPYVERFVLDGQSVRLTQAALETLAVIAYQQPVTRSRISAIRGVNCDGVVRTLVTRGLIEECGTQPESGAFLYRTTALFLEKLGLDSLDELPPLAPFLPDDVEGLADVPR